MLCSETARAFEAARVNAASNSVMLLMYDNMTSDNLEVACTNGGGGRGS